MRSKKTANIMRLIAIAVILGSLIALCADAALAQCVMCKASLSGNSTFVRNLNIGVFVLLVPPVSIFCTIFFLAFRHRKSS